MQRTVRTARSCTFSRPEIARGIGIVPARRRLRTRSRGSCSGRAPSASASGTTTIAIASARGAVGGVWSSCQGPMPRTSTAKLAGERGGGERGAAGSTAKGSATPLRMPPAVLPRGPAAAEPGSRSGRHLWPWTLGSLRRVARTLAGPARRRRTTSGLASETACEIATELATEIASERRPAQEPCPNAGEEEEEAERSEDKIANATPLRRTREADPMRGARGVGIHRAAGFIKRTTTCRRLPCRRRKRPRRSERRETEAAEIRTGIAIASRRTLAFDTLPAAVRAAADAGMPTSSGNKNGNESASENESANKNENVNASENARENASENGK
mmetsp:Transcript_77677/g.251569  ORF Transcript_77677/g.251569 Transcript_77677/m.251569 type:complete len:331 (-) Transcript_77677:2763-3755(-)